MKRRGPFPKNPAVHQHGPGSGGDKPAPVQHRFRLAGPKKPPRVSAQRLHPSVVVITVGPAGGVDLPGGNAHAAQGGDQKRRFLPAPPAAAAEDGERRGSTLILSLIGGVLMAPAVDFQHPRFRRGEIPDPRPESVVEDGPVKGQVLVVHPGKQDIVCKNFPVQRPAPRRLFPQSQGMTGKLQKQLWRITVQVALRQMIPQEGHRPMLVGSQICQHLLPFHPKILCQHTVHCLPHLHGSRLPGSSRTSSTVSAGSGSIGSGPRSAKTVSG